MIREDAIFEKRWHRHSIKIKTSLTMAYGSRKCSDIGQFLFNFSPKSGKLSKIWKNTEIYLTKNFCWSLLKLVEMKKISPNPPNFVRMPL